MSDTLAQLTAILAQRKDADPENSYVASLHHKGLNKILEKIGEEATELIIAAKDAESSGDRSALIGETADLWFHCMVMLSHLGGDATEVLDRLSQRLDISGLEEKASRQSAQDNPTSSQSK